ncbi:MAG: hypothetical protein JXA01_09305 [Dehalococcoidia bacterium]|nr:hypothetical protein [Dehalococcoidia bacterium]
MKVIYSSALLLITFCTVFYTACVSQEYPVTENYEETQYKSELTSETYTENQTSLLTDSGEFALASYFKWSSSGLSFSGIRNVYYYGYEIPEADLYDDIRLRVSVWQQLQQETARVSIFDMSEAGHIESPEPTSEGMAPEELPQSYLITGSASITWLKSANSIINHAKFLGGTGYLWSKPADPQIFYLDAGKASSIAVIVSGPINKWNGSVNLDVLWNHTATSRHTVTKERQVTRQVPYQVEHQRTVYKVKQVPFWEIVSSP